MEIYTSRYSNKRLKTGDYTAVSVTVGQPRFPLGYRVSGQIREIAPYELFKKGYEREEYISRYYQKMDRVGVERIRQIFETYAKEGKPLVLLCYEDVRDDSQFCHRRVFADWWKDRTGEFIGELPDESPVKTKKAPKLSETDKQQKEIYQLSMF